MCVYTMAWPSRSIVRQVELPHSVVIQLLMTGVCVCVCAKWPGQAGRLSAKSSDNTL